VGLLLVFDCDYGHAALIKDFNRSHQPFLTRRRGNLIVQAQVRDA
jgi:hypothetical protein